MATNAQSKNQSSNSTALSTKQLALNYRKSIISDLFNRIARHSSFDKIAPQNTSKELPVSKNSSGSKSKSSVQKINNVNVIGTSPFLNKSSLNQSFTCSNTSSISNKKAQPRSISNMREKYAKPSEILNQSQHLPATPEPSVSHITLSKAIKKTASNASLGKGSYDASAFAGVSEFETSNLELENSRVGTKLDLAESVELPAVDTKSATVSIFKLSKSDNTLGALQRECEKKIREVTHKFQLRDAMSRQEIAHIKQTNSVLQAQIKTLETEVFAYKKKREKELEYTNSLEKEIQKLKQREKQREKELVKETLGTEASLPNDYATYSKQGDCENDPTRKIDKLNQKIDSLTSEKQMLEAMLKNMLLSFEKSKFQHPQALLKSSSPANKTLSHLPDTGSNALQPKNLNLNENTGERSSLRLNELPEKENLQTESLLKTAYEKHNNSLEKLATIEVQLDEDCAYPNENSNLSPVKPEKGQNIQLLNDLNKLSSFMEDPIKFCTEEAFFDANTTGNELLQKALTTDVEVYNEAEFDLGSYSGRISPQKLVLKNIKRDKNLHQLDNRRKSSSKTNAGKLRLDLSKIIPVNKKNS